MKMNTTIRNIMDTPNLNLNDLTSTLDSGIIYIKNDVSLYCIINKQLPGLEEVSPFKYNIIFESGFLEIKNTKSVNVQVYNTKSGKFKRSKMKNSNTWSKWDLCYSSINTGGVYKGVMTEAYIKSIILRDYVRYDDTPLRSLLNTKVAASVIPNKLIRTGDTATGLIKIATPYHYTNIHMRGHGSEGVYMRGQSANSAEIYHRISAADDHVVRIGGHDGYCNRVIFQSINRPRIYRRPAGGALSDRGQILLLSEMSWKCCYNSGSDTGGTRGLNAPRGREYRVYQYASDSHNSGYAGIYHMYNGSYTGQVWDVQYVYIDSAGANEHVISFRQGDCYIWCHNDTGNDNIITRVYWR